MNNQQIYEEAGPIRFSLRKKDEPLKRFLSQDSDDEDQPPSLSTYALALLKKEQRENPEYSVHQCPKRVNFLNSSNSLHPLKSSEHVIQSNPNLTTTHSAHTTSQTEYETIFTKNVNDDLNSYATNSSISSADHKILKERTSGGNFSQNGTTTRLRSAVKRSRMFGSLGPPKRASHLEQSMDEYAITDDTLIKNAALEPSSQIDPTNGNQTFDFEGLNPYQYCKKYNLPSNDLPKIVKLYFQKQKTETRESLNTPVRLKEVIHQKIEQDLKELTPKRQNKRDEKSTIYSDKENIHHEYEHLNSIERPYKRQPLALLNDKKQDQLQNMMKPSSKPIKNEESTLQEYHYKQVEPLKAPDYVNKTNSRIITVNGKQYEKLELLGKGGSSKVFKVKSLNNKVYAIKKISFDEFDDSSIAGFKGEIDLLSRLRDQKRVVSLIDHSLSQGSLLLVMECGDIDLSHVLSKRLDRPFDTEFVRFHANEILKCVKAVHEAGIVHSDLKPANFLFVKGILKIIDFGISNAVPEHTVNIYRESQIGTPNYMAPEALIDNNQYLSPNETKSTWKVGKPSDIWSCGCIIYQMIYGRPPYGGYQGPQRLLAIMNSEIKITYPDKGLGGVKVPGTALETIQACLMRDPAERWTAQETLDGPFLKPRVVSEQFINDLVKNAITYGVSKSSIEESEMEALADDVWKRVSRLSL